MDEPLTVVYQGAERRRVAGNALFVGLQNARLYNGRERIEPLRELLWPIGLSSLIRVYRRFRNGRLGSRIRRLRRHPTMFGPGKRFGLFIGQNREYIRTSNRQIRLW